MNLFDPIEEHAQRNGDKIAIVFGNRRVTYGAFARNVLYLSVGLRRLGLKKGDRIALMMHNSPEMIYAFYAAMRLGLISVSLNIMFRKEEADYIVDDCEPKVIIVHSQYMEVAGTLDRVRKKQLKLVIVGHGDNVTDETVSFQSLCESEIAGEPPTLSLGPSDEAAIGYTSGTTGFPKGAVHTHANILDHLAGMTKQLALGEQDVILAALPFFQLTAFLVHPGLAFYSGATLVVMEKFEARPFLDLASRERVTCFAAVPTIFQMLYQAAKGSEDLSSVRFGLCGGSPLSVAARNDFEQKMKFRIIHCYGSTETPLIAAFERPDSPAKGVSVGNVSPHVTVRLVTARGMVASAGEEGEIHISAHNTLKCYWNKPDATRNAIRDGWFATGDIGKFDEEGYLHVVDRAKDMIIRGGFNIYPAELERVLLQDPRITEVVVVGEPHERLGEVPKAYVVVADGVHITEAEIIARSREKLASFKVPEEVEFVSSEFFPRNALGKVLKHKLRKRSGVVAPDHIGPSKDGLCSQGDRCGNTAGR